MLSPAKLFAGDKAESRQVFARLHLPGILFQLNQKIQIKQPFVVGNYFGNRSLSRFFRRWIEPTY